jgi:hypothetical protein
MATAPASTLRMKKIASARRLKVAAEQAADRAASAKEQVRSAKAQLKQARKLFKAEKKAAKQARKKLEAARNSFMVRPVRAAAAPGAVRAPKAPRAKSAAPKAASVKVPVSKTVRVRRKLRRAAKPVSASPEPMRSAAEVAKIVIERLQNPPAVLPPTPTIPAQPPERDPPKAP